MNPGQVVLALACVLAIAIGQVLFKIIGGLVASEPVLVTRTVLTTLLALALYGLATLGWILLLRHVPLTKAYPYMALSFVAVPLMGMMFLGERPSASYALGVLLIVVGVAVAVRSS